MELTSQQQSRLIQSLKRVLEKTYRAEVSEIQTHISTILLVANKAFKIKKPVNFGFLNFSTLHKRHFYCDEELRLNARLAPKLYESVLPIYGSIDNPALIPEGQCIEYMIQMQRFDHNRELDQLVENNQLTQSHIDNLADKIAEFHQNIAIADTAADYVQPCQIQNTVLENFEQIKPLHSQLPEDLIHQLETLERWCLNQYKKSENLIQTRLDQGFVRECHGDMHLGNITLIDDEITIFDGIEFNDAFRWIDIISDLAFLLMDLQYHDKPAYAYRLLNRYLENTGDYESLRLLSFYQVYRAMVRAKVAALRLTQIDNDDPEYQSLKQSFISHVDLAEYLTRHQCSFIMITHGVSGSGKSYVSQQIIEEHHAIRIRSDAERLRLFKDPEKRYSPEATDSIYQKLNELAEIAVTSGYSTVLDATYLKQHQRQAVRLLAEKLACRYLILSMKAEVVELEKRIRQRLAKDNDYSEATIEILHKQLASEEPLDDNEKIYELNEVSEINEATS